MSNKRCENCRAWFNWFNSRRFIQYTYNKNLCKSCYSMFSQLYGHPDKITLTDAFKDMFPMPLIIPIGIIIYALIMLMIIR